MGVLPDEILSLSFAFYFLTLTRISTNEMSMPQNIFWLILLGIGVATGALTGLTGASGMSILISALLLLGMPIRDVIAMTFVVTMVNSAAALPPFMAHKNLRLKPALYLSIPAFLAVFAGNRFAGMLSADSLTFIIIAALFGAGLKFTFSKETRRNTNASASQPDAHPGFLILAGALIGIIMGMLGGGGGVFISIALILLFRFPVKEAIGASIVVMGVAAVAGTWLHTQAGRIEWLNVLLIIAPSSVSAYLAGTFANRIEGATVKRILGVYLLIISTVLFLKTVLA